jgi:hypothetical protein
VCHLNPELYVVLDCHTWTSTVHGLSNCGHLSYDPHGVRKLQSEPRYACLWT